MKQEQKEFLQRRLRQAITAQPELKQLVRLLLKLGGHFVVAPPGRDSYATELIDAGFVFGGQALLKKGRVSDCHNNVANLWLMQRRHGIVGIGTGYGLSPDGLWRQHSWGILREGVLETTVARRKYFGLCLQGCRADAFSGVSHVGANEAFGTIVKVESR